MKLEPRTLFLGAAVAAAAGFGAAQKPAEPPASGLIVEKVTPGFEAAKAGFRPGDVLTAWERAPNLPANQAGARGVFRSPFDVLEILTEEAPRAKTMALTVSREGQRLSLSIGQYPWRLETRPALSEKWLSRYEEGRRLLEAGDREEGSVIWRDLAADLSAAKLRLDAAWLWLRLGMASSEAKQSDPAIAAIDRALEEARALGRGDVEAQLWGYKVEVLRANNRDKEAATAARRALSLREGLAPDSLSVARCLHELASVTDNNSRELPAIHRRALGIRERLAPRSSVEAASLGGLAIALGYQGDSRTEIDLLQKALAINNELDPAGRTVARGHSNLCAVYMNRGDLALAEEACQRSLELWRSFGPGDREGVRQSLHNLGVLARTRGDMDRAVQLLNQELTICDQIAPNGRGAVWNQFELAVTEMERKNFDKAEEHFRRSEQIIGGLKIVSAEAHAALTALMRAQIAYQRKDLATSEMLLRQALAYYERTAPDGYAAMAVGADLGRVLTERGATREAEDRIRRALVLRQRHSPESQDTAQSHHDLGMLFWKTRRLAEARDELNRAVEDLEAQQQKLGGSQESLSIFRDQHAEIYKDYVDLLIELRLHQDAFLILERYRAGAFLRTLARRDLAPPDEIPGDLQRDRVQVNSDYERVQGEIRGLDPKTGANKLDEAMAQLAELRRKRSEIAERIATASPRYAALRYPQPLDAAAAARALDPGTRLLSYSVGHEKTHLFVLGSDPRRSPLSVVTLPVGEDALRESVKAFRRLIELGNPSPELIGRARSLYDTLIRPAERLTDAGERVLIVPDGPLHTLPWAALVRDVHAGRPQYFVERKPIHTAISATVFAELKRARDERTGSREIRIAAFGDPVYPILTARKSGAKRSGEAESTEGEAYGETQIDAVLRGGYAFEPLPHTRQEVESIAALYAPNAETYLGERATEERARSLGRNISHVHYACHAYVNERFPLDSALVLSIPDKPSPGRDNGLLQAWEIFEKVRLDADLVTLSACDSGLGREMAGEGLIGLTRAFQYAGARSVLASLWKVDDISTAELMKRFYGHLKGGKPKDEALRLAQLDLIGTGRYAQPRDWAAFGLAGDWR